MWVGILIDGQLDASGLIYIRNRYYPGGGEAEAFGAMQEAEL